MEFFIETNGFSVLLLLWSSMAARTLVVASLSLFWNGLKDNFVSVSLHSPIMQLLLFHEYQVDSRFPIPVSCSGGDGMCSVHSCCCWNRWKL